MKTLNLIALTLGVVLVVSWGAIVLYPSVQDFMTSNPTWNGLSSFGARHDAEPVTSAPAINPNSSSGSLLLVIPYRPYVGSDLETMKQFVLDGGTLLLMDDFGYGNQVLDDLGVPIRFDGDPLLDPYLCYRNEWFPLVTDMIPGPNPDKPLQIVLDHATALHVPQGDYRVLAESSETSFIDLNGNGTLDKDEPKGPLPVAVEADLGKGKVIAVSDPSILINSMIVRGDNALFVRQLVSLAGNQAAVMVDTSHLAKSPLDQSKYLWQTVRSRMGAPYALLMLVGAVLTVVWVPFGSKGGKFGQ